MRKTVNKTPEDYNRKLNEARAVASIIIETGATFSEVAKSEGISRKTVSFLVKTVLANGDSALYSAVMGAMANRDLAKFKHAVRSMSKDEFKTAYPKEKCDVLKKKLYEKEGQKVYVAYSNRIYNLIN